MNNNISKTTTSVSCREKREENILFLSITRHHLENIIIKFFQGYGKKKQWIAPLSICLTMILTYISTDKFVECEFLGIHNEFFFRLVIIVLGIGAFVFAIYRFYLNRKNKEYTQEKLLDSIIKACDNGDEETECRSPLNEE